MMRLSTRTKESIALVTQEQWNSPPGVFQKWLRGIFWDHKSITQEFTDTNLVARKFANKYGKLGKLL